MPKNFAEENLPPEVQAIADRMNIDPAAIVPAELPPLPFDRSCTPGEFISKRRKELVELMEKYMYGKIPPRCESLTFRTTGEGVAYDGLAIRREIDIICRNKGMEQILHMLLYIPAKRKGKVPVFFGLNFKGNHTCTDDPEVTYHPFTPFPSGWNPRMVDGRATAEYRGKFAERFDFKQVLEAGYATATVAYGDIFPDNDYCFEESIMRFFYTRKEWDSPDRDTGAISAWAWGISRSLDALETQPEIDMKKVIVHGHSRLGKTALWAGANDPRITITVSNGSGTCGAKLAHHNFGETYHWINFWNPHWLRADFQRFNGKDQEIPVDQHFLMAAIAPRLLYVSDGTTDDYADPAGSFMAIKAAEPAWELFGMSGVAGSSLPEPSKLCGKDIGYYLRIGGHAFTSENWTALINFVKSKF